MAETNKTREGPSTLRSLKDVKDRFLEAYNKYTESHHISDTHMATLLGVKASTLRDTLNPTSTNLNTNIVLAFCLKFRTLDIEKLFVEDIKEPEDDLEKISQLNKGTKKNFTIFRHSYDCHELTDQAFMGNYYGYCRNTQYPNSVEHFVLRIDYNTHNEMQAKIELTSYNQKKQETKKILYGKPMHLEPNIIYIVLSSPQKKRAVVPGPVWLPIVVPMLLIRTLPFNFLNFFSIISATFLASA